MSIDTTNWNNCLEIAAASDVGMRRSNNQDAFVVMPASDEATWRSRGHLFVVADGMGAHAAGELASRLAADGLAHHYYKYLELSPPEAIARAVRDTNEEIHLRGVANSEFHNMGTTCSCLLLLPQGALLAHVGDSRVYRLRGNRLQQLTFDHSLVWEMRAAGQIKGIGAGIPKNVITRSLGPQPDVKPDIEGPFRVQPGDKFIVCSDGIMARIDDEEIGLVTNILPPQEAADFFVDLANARGGPDNSTIIVVEVKDDLSAGDRRVKPLTVRGELKPATFLHPATWFILYASLLVTVGLLIIQLWLPAFVFAVVAAIVTIYIVYHRIGGESSDGGVVLSETRRLGKAPYVDVDCAVRSSRVIDLILTAESLVSVQSEVAPGTKRDRVSACLAEAKEKAHQGEFVEALRLMHVALRIMLGKQ